MQIDVTGLTKTFGRVRALDSMDLTVPTGMFGLLGANGAGKTTLMRILAGLLRPTTGQARIDRHDVATKPGRLAIQRILGDLPQDLGVYPDLTARELLDHLALLKGIDDRPSRRRRVAELLEVVSLSETADRRLRGFSGGMRRRVGIAQACSPTPSCSSSTNPPPGSTQRNASGSGPSYRTWPGDRTVLLSTHIVEDIAQTCHEIAVLTKGRLAFRCTVTALAAHAHGHVWSLDTTGPAPTDGTIVSALPHDAGMRYRVVALDRP